MTPQWCDGWKRRWAQLCFCHSRSLSRTMVEGLSGHRTSPWLLCKGPETHPRMCAEQVCLYLPSGCPSWWHPATAPAAENSPLSFQGCCTHRVLQRGALAHPVLTRGLPLPLSLKQPSSLPQLTRMHPLHLFLFCLFNYYNIVLVSALQQCEPAIITHWAPVPPPSRPSRSSQSARLGSLYYTATSHQPSVVHRIVCICWCYFLHPSHSLPPPYILHLCVSIPSLQIFPTLFICFHLNCFFLLILNLICFFLSNYSWQRIR